MTRVVNLRTGAVLAVVAVAVFGAVQSFNHIRWIGQTHGQGALDSVLLPLSIDGLILAMTLVLLHEASEDKSGPLLAWGLLWLGIGATIAANVIFGQRFGRVGIGASVWPAIAFVGAVHVMTKVVRSESVPVRDHASAEEPPADAGEPDPEEAARLAYLASVEGGNPLSQLQLHKQFGISRPRAKALVTGSVTEVATMSAAGAGNLSPRPVPAASNGHRDA